ncbi:MAG: ArgE/DapE family deacylase [Azospirillaceae bacterium]
MTETAPDIAGTLAELIRIPAPYPPGDTGAICEAIAERLRGFGYTPEIVGPDATRRSVVAAIGSGKPEIVLNAHIDTITPGRAEDWSAEPYSGTVRDGRVWGLGAENCKGAAAVQMHVAEAIAARGGPKRGRVVFTFVGDEESLDTGGTRFLRDQEMIAPDMLVLGGPTGCQLSCEERGVLWLEVACRGRSVHAGNPTIGDNAITRAARLIHRLETVLTPRLAERVSGPFRATMSIGTIEGGHNLNAVPDHCVFGIDRRVLPPPAESVEAATGEIRALLAEAGEPEGSWTLERKIGTDGFRCPKDGPGITAHAEAIAAETGAPAEFLISAGVSDGRHFSDLPIEIVAFGPGDGDRGHRPDEYVEIAQLERTWRIHLAALARLTDGWKDA